MIRSKILQNSRQYIIINRMRKRGATYLFVCFCCVFFFFVFEKENVFALMLLMTKWAMR